MAHLAVRVSFVHGKGDVVVFKVAISADVQLSGAGRCPRRREKRIAALRAKEMLFVVSSLSECGVVKGNKSFVDDSGLAMEASRCKCLMVVKVTIGFSFVFERGDVLQQLIANRAPETSRMPSYSHSAHDSSYDRSFTAATEQTT